jgi:hypothetical protein
MNRSPGTAATGRESRIWAGADSPGDNRARPASGPLHLRDRW